MAHSRPRKRTSVRAEAERLTSLCKCASSTGPHTSASAQQSRRCVRCPMLQAVRSTHDGVLRITLTGAIDDMVELGPLFLNLPDQVAVDLRGVERINSIGVRNWVDLMGRITEDHELTIEGVSYPIVMQAICVRSFFGKANVHSCMAPYFCPKCRRLENVVVRHDEVSTGPAEKRCSSCSEPMYFDELDQYFRVFEET